MDSLSFSSLVVRPNKSHCGFLFWISDQTIERQSSQETGPRFQLSAVINVWLGLQKFSKKGFMNTFNLLSALQGLSPSASPGSKSNVKSLWLTQNPGAENIHLYSIFLEVVAEIVPAERGIQGSFKMFHHLISSQIYNIWKHYLSLDIWESSRLLINL